MTQPNEGLATATVDDLAALRTERDRLAAELSDAQMLLNTANNTRTELANLLNSTRVELVEERRRHREDIEIVGEEFRRVLEDNYGGGDVYDRVVDNANPRLSVELATRYRPFNAEVNIRVLIRGISAVDDDDADDSARTLVGEIENSIDGFEFDDPDIQVDGSVSSYPDYGDIVITPA